MNIQDLIDYYVNLLIMQYKDKPKARATVEAYVTQVVSDQIGIAVRDAFDLETAVGAQLDILGRYVGAKRAVNGLDINRTFLGMPPYTDAAPGSYKGFALYGTTPTAYFARYNDFKTVYNLTDPDLRKLIKLRIRQHMSNHSLKDIDAIMYDFFGSECSITDSGNMELTYAFTPGSTDTFIKIAIFTDSLPRPAGVKINTGV